MTARPAWLASLTAVASAAQIDTASPSLHDYTVDGLTPQVVVYPDSAEQVAALLHWAQQEKLAVLPCGGATTLQLGNVPNRFDVVISTNHLTQVHEYDVANFTLTAGAGVPFSQVAELTATRMQTLPLQYAFSAATLGGLVATQAYNPKRLLYGGVRDLLLGLRVALPSGEIAHFGGKVVKNVAGYDMSKLFVGSLGALGIIVETTWKLFALPERDESLLAVFPSLGQGASAVAQIMATQLLPSQMLLLHSTAARTVAPAGSKLAERPVPPHPQPLSILTDGEGSNIVLTKNPSPEIGGGAGEGASPAPDHTQSRTLSTRDPHPHASRITHQGAKRPWT